MRNTLRLTRYVALTAAVASLIGLGIGLRNVTAKETPANDCLIALQGSDNTDKVGEISCNDCDPACDADTDNSTPNGQCTFRLRAVLNHPTTGCTAADLKKAKVLPKKSGIVIVPSGSSSVDGAFANVVVRLKGKKPKKSLLLKAIAVANGKPKRNDLDKLKLTCVKQTATCPTTTTTTTTTTSSTTLPPSGICSDGTPCAPAANPTTCTTGTCLACAPATGTLSFTTGTNVTANCGGVGLQPEADPPTSGTVTVRDLQLMTNSVLNIGAGCLYVGGGASTVPGGATPDGSTSTLDVKFSCPDTNNTLLVGGHTGDKLSCSKGAGPGKSCIDNLTVFPLRTCSTDDDCKAAPGDPTIAGSCVQTPNCFFGPPLPIPNGPLSTCVVNTFGSDASGQITKTTGESKLVYPLKSHTFVTSNGSSPCPQCVANACVGGSRDTLACTAVGTQLTSLDCPPGGVYLPEFPVALDPLSTATVTKSDPGGIFCPGQGLNPGDGAPGAFGTNTLNGTDLVMVAIQIQEIGSAAGDLSDNAPHAATLASVFCIPATGNALIDGAASLPGPGGVSLPGSVQLQ